MNVHSLKINDRIFLLKENYHNFGDVEERDITYLVFLSNDKKLMRVKYIRDGYYNERNLYTRIIDFERTIKYKRILKLKRINEFTNE